MSNSPSMSSKGADAGSSVSNALKGALKGAEDFRQGVNNFADNAIQPSAARDAERGVTDQHKKGTDVHAVNQEAGHTAHTAPGPAMGTGTAGLHSGGTHSSSGTVGGGSGISSDAKNLGNKIENAFQGSGKSH